ncbi:Methylated-DNA--protein-cysteine methyltransferase [uncultured archaeon]|nr:Methylated-DNA--protein-cysteine methyltransferase [uncultured archaeon]
MTASIISELANRSDSVQFTKEQKGILQRLTKFQRDVLLACARIPKGQTRTYAQLARSIGKPHSARAVGNALAINPLAPLIPCHRVVRSDGKLGGYSAQGGTKTKMSLLLAERRSI